MEKRRLPDNVVPLFRHPYRSPATQRLINPFRHIALSFIDAEDAFRRFDAAVRALGREAPPAPK